jgi:hypothetical protein
MTKCYTYEVTMKIQVLAETEELAKVTLDDKGGYVSQRNVQLITTTELQYPDDEFIEIIHSMDKD